MTLPDLQLIRADGNLVVTLSVPADAGPYGEIWPDTLTLYYTADATWCWHPHYRTSNPQAAPARTATR